MVNEALHSEGNMLFIAGKVGDTFQKGFEEQPDTVLLCRCLLRNIRIINLTKFNNNCADKA